MTIIDIYIFVMRIKLAFYLIVLFSGFNINSTAQYTAQAFLNKFEQDEQLDGASIGFCAINRQSGAIVAKSNKQLNLTPASVQKLITTGSALHLLGCNYTFKTTLAYSGDIKNGTLNGNIVIIAGGDPTLGSKYFAKHADYNSYIQKWASLISKLGINKVNGQIIVDLSCYDKQSIPNTWIWEDMGNYYGAGTYALSAYDNTCEITFKSPSQAQQITSITNVTPQLNGIELINEVVSSNINKDLAYVFGGPHDCKRIIRGSIPKGQNAFKVKASLPNPPAIVAQQLLNQLAKQNIGINEEIIYQYDDNQETLHTIHTINSPKLSEIVKLINHESVNLFTEHLVKQIAYEKYGKSASFGEGINLIKSYWNSEGINIKYLEDGSGLSRFNAITAQQLTDILYNISQNPEISNAFYNSLPIVPNGTLWYFNQSYFANNCLRAKSGSMTRVRSFAGELITNKGEHILFTIIVNNFNCSQNLLIKKIEKLLFDMKNI